MAYDGRAVANYFLELATADGEPVTPMKIQKLLYFAHGWFLALYNEPLVAEGFQAWKHGPVSADVYSAFRGHKWHPIDRPAMRVLPAEGGGFEWRPVPTPPTGDDDDELARWHIESAWAVYKTFSAEEMSAATHKKGTPWDKLTDGGRLSAQRLSMDNYYIKEYFDKLLEKNGGAK